MKKKMTASQVTRVAGSPKFPKSPSPNNQHPPVQPLATENPKKWSRQHRTTTTPSSRAPGTRSSTPRSSTRTRIRRGPCHKRVI